MGAGESKGATLAAPPLADVQAPSNMAKKTETKQDLKEGLPPDYPGNEETFKDDVRKAAGQFKNLVQGNKVMIFSATYCSYCTVAKVNILLIFLVIVI